MHSGRSSTRDDISAHCIDFFGKQRRPDREIENTREDCREMSVGVYVKAALDTRYVKCEEERCQELRSINT